MRTPNFRIRILAVAVVCAVAFSFLPSAVNAQKKAKSAASETVSADPVIPSVQKAEDPDLEFIYRLREEEFRHGQVMEIMSNLIDNIGPRLTGSPNMKKANEWTRDQLTQWGLVNAKVEPWGTFGRGWAYQSASVRMTAPDTMQFIALPQAWTPGTNGPISGTPVLVSATTPDDLAKYKGQLTGKIVMLGDPRYPDPLVKPQFFRYDDAELDKLATYEIPGAPGQPRQAGTPDRRAQFRFFQALQAFMQQEKPAAVLVPSRSPGQDGTIFVQSGGSYEKGKTSVVPTLTVSLMHYNRVLRLLAKKQPVTLEVNVQAQFYDDDDKGYNTVAEIPGTDPKLKAQLVMLGGHMDSWHAGTGATDNAAGVAVTMEAVRLLQKLGVKPRRTIRIGLWGGEEQGLLGSRGYAKEHFGSRPDAPVTAANRDLPSFMRPPAGPLQLKPEQKYVSGYFNYDNGTGRIRGIYLQENALVAPIFRKWMEPLRDLGMTTLSPRNTSGTDHLAFDAVGIPGFQFIQDEMDYDTLTHHSNVDVYEHIRADDLKQAAVVMASFVYHTAQRDEMLPRKPIRPDDPRPVESESGAEKRGEPAPPPSNPVNPSRPMPPNQQQPRPTTPPPGM